MSLLDYTESLNLDAKAIKGSRRRFMPFIVTGDNEGMEVYDDGGPGLSFHLPDNHAQVGDVGIVGIDGFNNVGFIFVNGQVLRNKSREDYGREHTEFVQEWERDKRNLLEENRADWEARESYLSDASKSRLEFFRDNGSDFELEGWGYELVIAELTDYLVDSNLELTDAIQDYSDHEGCSGNQFEYAKALAQMVIDGKPIAGAAGGLAPLGTPLYY